MLTRAGSTTGILTATALAMLAVGCRKEGVTDQGQIGAAVGEVMASADESANGGSTTAMLPASRSFRCCAPPPSCGRRCGVARWTR